MGRVEHDLRCGLHHGAANRGWRVWLYRRWHGAYQLRQQFCRQRGPYAAAIAALAYGDHLMAKAGWGLDNNRKAMPRQPLVPLLGAWRLAHRPARRRDRQLGRLAQWSARLLVPSPCRYWIGCLGITTKPTQTPQAFRLIRPVRFFRRAVAAVQQKGGTFRSDNRWTDTYDVSSDIDKELDSAFRKTVAKLQDMGKTLGVETSKSIDGFTHEFSLQLSENGDMSKAGEKLAAEIGRAADELVAKMVPNIDEFARLGESASQTFSRLNQEVTATDAILIAMGKTQPKRSAGSAGLNRRAGKPD